MKRRTTAFSAVHPENAEFKAPVAIMLVAGRQRGVVRNQSGLNTC